MSLNQFVLDSRDPAAPRALLAYAKAAEQRHWDPVMIKEIRDTADVWAAQQLVNPDWADVPYSISWRNLPMVPAEAAFQATLTDAELEELGWVRGEVPRSSPEHLEPLDCPPFVVALRKVGPAATDAELEELGGVPRPSHERLEDLDND